MAFREICSPQTAFKTLEEWSHIRYAGGANSNADMYLCDDSRYPKVVLRVASSCHRVEPDKTSEGCSHNKYARRKACDDRDLPGESDPGVGNEAYGERYDAYLCRHVDYAVYNPECLL